MSFENLFKRRLLNSKNQAMKSILSLLITIFTFTVSAQDIKKDYAVMDKFFAQLGIPYVAENTHIENVMEMGGESTQMAFSNILRHHGYNDPYTYFTIYTGDNQVIPDGAPYCNTLSQMYENKPAIKNKINTLKDQSGSEIKNFEQLMDVFLYNLRERCPNKNEKNSGFGEINIEDKEEEKDPVDSQMDLVMGQFAQQLQGTEMFKQFTGNGDKSKPDIKDMFKGSLDSMANVLNPTGTKAYQDYLDKYETKPSEKNELNTAALAMFTEFQQEHGRMPVTKEDYEILTTMDGFEEFSASTGVDAETMIRMMELSADPNNPENKKEIEALMKKYPHLAEKKPKPKKKIDMAQMMRDAMQPLAEKGLVSQEDIDKSYGEEYEKAMEPYLKQSESMGEQIQKMNKPDENGNINFDMTPLLELEGFGESKEETGLSDHTGSASVFHSQSDASKEMFNVGAYKEFKALKGRDQTAYFNEVLNYESIELYSKRLNKKQYFQNQGCKETFADIIENNINFKLNYGGNGGNMQEKMEGLEIYDNGMNFKELDDKCPYQSFTPDSYKELKSNLLPTEAMVSINVYKDRDQNNVRYVFSIIKKNESEPTILQFENGKILENSLLDEYKNSMRKSDFSESLYAGYWKGVDQLLKGVSKIYLIADGIYHFVNIGSLPAPEDNFRFIDEKYEIIYLVGPSSLKSYKKNQKNSIKKIKIFAGIDYGQKTEKSKYNFKFLSKSASEMQSIAAIASNSSKEIEVETSNSCSESDFIDFKGQVLHMSTHSFLDSATILTFHGEKNRKGQESSFGTNARIMMGHTTVAKSDPTFRSGIAMTKANQFVDHPKRTFDLTDGILFSYEIEALNFTDLDLVFLNSCVSGKGDIKNGMGVYGLQRSFFEAGVNSILMSTFNLSDRVSKSFAEEFYSELLIKNKSKSTSFKTAIDNIRVKENKLRHWTPYRLIHM